MTAWTRHARALLLAAVALAAVSCTESGDLVVPVDADPDVRGTFLGTFIWAVAEPRLPIGEIDPDRARESVDKAAAVSDDDRDLDFGITVVAAFETAEQAERHAADVREILEGAAAWYADPANAATRRVLEDPEQPAPLTPPEEAALNEHNLAAGTRGVGWGGAPGTADTAVYTLGPVLMVTGLKSETQADLEAPVIHPIVHLLAAEGGTVLLEGHRFGEGSITADVSCRPPVMEAGLALRDEIGDALATSQFYTRPPWLEPPLTDAEELARATYRRWMAGIAASMNESWARELINRYSQAKSEEELLEVTRELEQEVTGRGLQHIEGELDPATLALLGRRPAFDDDEGEAVWTRELAERMGGVRFEDSEYGPRPIGDDYARMGTTGSVRVQDGDRLELGWLMFGRFAAGMPYLAAYLQEQGCEDLKLGIVDFDDVRGD